MTASCPQRPREQAHEQDFDRVPTYFSHANSAGRAAHFKTKWISTVYDRILCILNVSKTDFKICLSKSLKVTS